MTDLSKKAQCGKRWKDHKSDKPVRKEKDLQNICIEYLNARRIRYVRVPDVAYRTLFGSSGISGWGERKRAKKGVYGAPDMTVLFPSGRYLAVELKSKAGKLSKEQECESCK